MFATSISFLERFDFGSGTCYYFFQIGCIRVSFKRQILALRVSELQVCVHPYLYVIRLIKFSTQLKWLYNNCTFSVIFEQIDPEYLDMKAVSTLQGHTWATLLILGQIL